MTLTAELYTAAAGDRLRSATEKSVEVWKQGAQGLTDRVDMVPQLRPSTSPTASSGTSSSCRRPSTPNGKSPPSGWSY